MFDNLVQMGNQAETQFYMWCIFIKKKKVGLCVSIIRHKKLVVGLWKPVSAKIKKLEYIWQALSSYNYFIVFKYMEKLTTKND